MDPKQFQNDSVRKRFARAHVHEFCPTLNFICNIMEKHVKEDKRKEGRYNLVHLIEKVSEFNFKNVPMETLSEDDKDSLQVKANAAIEDCHKTPWSKNKDSKEYSRAHQNEYSDPKRDTWMFKNGKWDTKYDD